MAMAGDFFSQSFGGVGILDEAELAEEVGNLGGQPEGLGAGQGEEGVDEACGDAGFTAFGEDADVGEFEEVLMRLEAAEGDGAGGVGGDQPGAGIQGIGV